MSQNEVLKTLERTYPNGFMGIEGMPQAQDLLSRYAHDTVTSLRIFQDNARQLPLILGSFCGSVIPTFHVLSQWIMVLEDPELFVSHMAWVSTQKNGANAHLTRLTEPRATGSCNVYVLEDIVDEVGTLQAIEEAYPDRDITAWAPLQKAHTANALDVLLPSTSVYTLHTSPNAWIASGGGLDVGSAKLKGETVEDRATLALAQRLTTEFVGVDLNIEDDHMPPYEEQLEFFQSLRDPRIPVESDLYGHMLQLEIAKMSGDFSLLAKIAQTLPTVMIRHITTQ